MQNKNKHGTFFHFSTTNNNDNKKHSIKKIQWNEFLLAYDSSLKKWIDSYKIWQQSGEKALKEYSNVMEKASKENNIKLMRELTEKWSETWNIAGKNNPYSWYWTSWKKIWEESSYVTTNAFNQYWQKVWQNNSNDFFTRSDEVLKELNKKWMDS